MIGEGYTATNRVHLRAARLRDALKIRRWRNEPTARANMVNREPIGLLEHLRFYRAALRNIAIEYFIIRDLEAGRDIGFARLKYSFVALVPSADVSIVVDRNNRRAGTGTAAIRRLVSLAVRRGVYFVEAEIQRDNLASRRAFEKAGFVLEREYPEFVWMVRRINLTETYIEDWPGAYL